MEYYFDEFATEEIQKKMRHAGNNIPRAKLIGDLDDVKKLENIVRSGAKELLQRLRDEK